MNLKNTMKVPLNELLAKATPRPYQTAINTNTERDLPEIHGRNGNMCVAGEMGCGPEADANAALLCHSANCIEELVEALRSAIGCIEASLDEVPESAREAQENDLIHYRSALAKAENVEVQ